MSSPPFALLKVKSDTIALYSKLTNNHITINKGELVVALAYKRKKDFIWRSYKELQKAIRTGDNSRKEFVIIEYFWLTPFSDILRGSTIFRIKKLRKYSVQYEIDRFELAFPNGHNYVRDIDNFDKIYKVVNGEETIKVIDETAVLPVEHQVPEPVNVSYGIEKALRDLTARL